MMQQSLALAASAPIRQPVQLRDYQQAAIDAIEQAWANGFNRPLFVVPTGGGKTVIFSAVIDRLLIRNPGQRVLIIAHRQELLQQALDKYSQFFTPRSMGMISAKVGRYEYTAQITAASKDSLSQKRLANLLANGPIDLLVIDEAHHASAQSYLKLVALLASVNPAMRVLGATATPERADGTGLGGVFSAIPGSKTGAAYTLAIGDLIRAGHLCQPNWLAIYTGKSLKGVKKTGGDYNTEQLTSAFDTPDLHGLIVETHKKYALGEKALVFTVSVNGSKKDQAEGERTGGAIALAERFRAEGITAAVIHGGMKDAERQQVLADFASGAIEVLCNCAVLTEGFDDPSIRVIHMACPTQSDVKYTQCIGRGLRTMPGKTRCLILEYAPAESRNLSSIGWLMGVPPEQQQKIDQAQQVIDQQALAPGGVMASFGYDGSQIGMIGDGLGVNALAIIGMQIDYLESTAWAASRVDMGHASATLAGATIVALGKSPGDELHRILVLAPGADDSFTLYGIWRREHQPDAGIWESWTVRQLHEGITHQAAIERIEAIASRHGDSVLGGKAQAWREQPATEGQIKKVMRLMRKRKMPAELEDITKGRASELISQLEAEAALKEYLAVHEPTDGII